MTNQYSHRGLFLALATMLALGAALLISSLNVTSVSADATGSGSTGSGTSFTDTADHWGKTYIDWLSSHCGVHGYRAENGDLTGMFKPDQRITRAEFVKIVIGCKYPATGSGSMTGSGSTGSGSTGSGSTASGALVFPDVPADHWAAWSIAKAKELGIVTGYADGTFKPNQRITRAEIVAIVIRSEFSGANMDSTSTPFDDVDEGAWFAKYVAFAAEKNVVSGYKDANGDLTGEFGPTDAATRAEAAKIVSNGLNVN